MTLLMNTVNIAEKNALSSDGTFLALLKIELPNGIDTFRLVANNEDVIWPHPTLDEDYPRWQSGEEYDGSSVVKSGGHFWKLRVDPAPSTFCSTTPPHIDETNWEQHDPGDGSLWQAFPFTLDEIIESKDQVPKVVFKVGNATRQLEGYLEDARGGVGSSVTLYIINSKHLTLTTAEVELLLKSTGAKAGTRWVTFPVGAEMPGGRFPRSRINRNFCRYRQFKGDRCGYGGAETDCNRSLARCRDLLNSQRFGGAPGVNGTELYV